MSSQPRSEMPACEAAHEATQLTQVRVPLERAAEVFSTRDESGRIPIVVIAERAVRVSVMLLIAAGLVLVAGFFLDTFFRSSQVTWLGLVAALAMIGVVAYQASRVRIPEGINALLARAGKYTRTIGPGLSILLPWVTVTHLVTRREIPFTVPIEDAPAQDNVRALVNTLIVFTIAEPHRFVFNISADDFDLVLHAACQNEMRRMIRGINSDQINDLPRHDLTALRQTLGEQMASYGIAIIKVSITYAQPPPDFMQSQEARELAAFQQREQQERQALALRRQADADALARQIALAQEEREREVLDARQRKEEARKQLVATEARVAELRLELLEQRLGKFPTAAKWERLMKQLSVMRALAGNARTIVQFGNSDGILRAMLMQEVLTPNANGQAENSLVVEEQDAAPDG